MKNAVRLGCLIILWGCPGVLYPLQGPIDRVSDSIIQIGIAQGVSRITIIPQGRFSIIDQSNGEEQPLLSGRAYSVETDEGKRLTVGPYLLMGQSRLLRSRPEDYVLVEGVKYRGNLIFKPNGDSTFTVIDELGLEEYLYGVLPTEMSPEWPLEALKAQAVVARTFALSNLGKFSNSGFDLSDDSRSQVYSGVEIESERVRQAVQDTAGQYLYWRGKILPAFFHSCCGGRTADPEVIWGSLEKTPAPLRGVRDRYCRNSPYYQWAVTFPKEDLARLLSQQGRQGSHLSSIRLGGNASGYPRVLSFVLDGKTVAVRTHEFRKWVGMTKFKSAQVLRIARLRDSYQFMGRGFGHGVGLCQWGAKGQAEQGKSYSQILAFYFPGAQIAIHED